MARGNCHWAQPVKSKTVFAACMDGKRNAGIALEQEPLANHRMQVYFFQRGTFSVMSSVAAIPAARWGDAGCKWLLFTVARRMKLQGR